MEEYPIELITRYLSHDATNEEQQQLLDWIAADPRNQQLFNEYAAAWNRSHVSNRKFSVEARLAKINLAIDQYEASQRLSKTWIVAVAAAAVLLVVIGISSLLFVRQPEVEMISTTVPYGEKVSLTLADGTKVMLNSGSTLLYPDQFIEDNRLVSLEGEAFFDVKRDEKHPFIVETGATQTRVLGTSFNIRQSDDKITVAVATGKVQVEAGQQSVALVPNEMAVWLPSAHSLRQQKASLEKELAWSQNAIHFDNETLGSAARTLEKWYDVKIIFENKDLSNCLISGRFRNVPLSKVLEALEFSLGVKCYVDNKDVTIKGKGCN